MTLSGLTMAQTTTNTTQQQSQVQNMQSHLVSNEIPLSCNAFNGRQADSPSRKELELFLKEVQTLAKLHHRNIVQFYGACLETGSMFFVTELMKVGNSRSNLTPADAAHG